MKSFLTKRTTKHDFPTAVSPSRTSLKWCTRLLGVEVAMVLARNNSRHAFLCSDSYECARYAMMMSIANGLSSSESLGKKMGYECF